MLIQDFDNRKPKKKLWPFALALTLGSSFLFLALYYISIISDSLMVPFLFMGFTIPSLLMIEFFPGSYFKNDSWRLRDIYKFRSYMNGGYLKFIMIFGIISFGLIAGISIPEPDLYGENPSSLFTKSKLEFDTAQAVHRSYMILFYAAYFFLVHYFIMNQITKKAEQLTYSPVRIPNKPSEYQEKGYFNEYYRYFGEKYFNVRGEIVKSQELIDWLTEISTDRFKWPIDDFFTESPFKKGKVVTFS